MNRRLLAHFVAQLCLAVCMTTAQAQHAEDLTLEEMCRNGLATNAIRYAEVQRNFLSDDPPLYAKWTMRLMECLAQSAFRDSAETAEAWESCAKTYEAFVAARPSDARLPWLTWQLARCDLLHAQSKLVRFLASPALSQERDDALALVRRIEKQLESLEDDVRRRLPLAARPNTSGGTAAPAEQLANLLVDADLLRCEALLIRARLYEAGSRDRIAAATDVESRAADILKRTGPDWSSRDALLMAKATAELELGKSSEALALLTQLARQASTGNVRHRAAMIAIEALTATGNIRSARNLLPTLSGLGAEAGAGAEAQIAKLQIAIAELATDNAEGRDSQLARIVEQSKRLGDEYGDYWRNRAEALLTGSVSLDSVATGASIGVDLVIIEVRQLLAAGRDQEAVQRLLQVRDNEAAGGRGETAIELASMASALLQRQQKWLEAADVLASTCVNNPQAEQASAAHVRAIYSISQAVREAASSKEIAERYESALKKQLELWPDSSHTDESQLWLGRWLAGLQRTEEFAETLAKRAAGCQDAAIATRVLLDWLAAVLQVADAGHRRQLAANMEEQIETGAIENAKQAASVIQLTAFAYAQWPSREESKQIRASIYKLALSTSAPDERKLLTAAELLLEVQAGSTQASEVSKRWSPDELSPNLRMCFAPTLVEAVGELPNAYQRRWAGQLKFDARWAEELISSSNLVFRAAGFRMQQWCGDADAALEGLKDLAAENPRNGPLQLQLSAALADSGKSGLAESTRLARKLAASSRAASELYLASRWRLVRNELLGDGSENAKSMAKLVLATQPIEAAVWRERFESVARE